MAREPDARTRGGARRGEATLAAPAIAAIATPPGRGGIGIVRVSGSGLAPLIEAIAGRSLEPRHATHVAFRDAQGATIDDGLALYFPSPRSYTGEDVVEWHGHGGPAVMRLLLARCVELGARLAEPGEFTKRAFLIGKLDLAQAASVADVSDAATATAVRAAARSLTGEFSREVRALRDALIDVRMYTEATLDFPEEDLDLVRDGDVGPRLYAIRARLEALVSRARSGALLREGLAVVLVGAPNVGKSSILNRLVGEDAAIVTPIPGTTRDTIERQVEIDGIPLTIVDTAGLRDTHDEVERLGIERTRAAIERADLALVLVDARDDAADPKSGERSCAELLRELPSRLPRIVVHNKCDLAFAAPHVERHAQDAPGELQGSESTHVWTCALTGEGIELLRREVLRLAGVEHTIEDAFFARERHLAALGRAREHLDAAAAHAARSSPPLELFAEELREAQQAFASITGEFTADDLLGEIFSRFCIGK
jgi:tRNA modification GTPase